MQPTGAGRCLWGFTARGGSGRDCWSDWQRYADQEGFILVCPSLDDGSGGWSQNDGEFAVNQILNAVYDQYAIDTRFFLAGFSAGGQFVQMYTFNYPRSVAGVSVMSAGNYFEPTQAARNVPFLVTIGENDTERIPGAQGFSTWLVHEGFDITYEVIPGVGHSLSDRARELTIQHFRETAP